MSDDVKNLKRLMEESKFVLTSEIIGGQLTGSWPGPGCSTQECSYAGCNVGCEVDCLAMCYSPVSYP